METREREKEESNKRGELVDKNRVDIMACTAYH